LFLVKVRSYNGLFAFTSTSALLAENARNDEQLADAREGVHTFRIQGRVSRCVGMLQPTESRSPMSAHFYISDSDLEAEINMRCCIMSGWDKEIVATIQPVLSQGKSFVEMFLRAGESIRKQEVITKPRESIC